MYFLGWHGTAHSNAHSLLTYGIRAERARAGQLGLGFYIAKFGLLLSSAARPATDLPVQAAEAMPPVEDLSYEEESKYIMHISAFRKAFAYLTGVNFLQLSQMSAHEIHISIANLKVYAMEPLSITWEGMHPSDEDVIRQLVEDDGQAPAEQYQTRFLRACIPLEQIKYLRVGIDDGMFEELYDGRVDRARRVKHVPNANLSPPGAA